MIKGNELRVGNHVYDDTNTIVKIEKIHSERHALWSESEYFDFSKFDDKENMYSSIVNPIPLSKEWFLKSGFKENKHGTLILKLELDRSFEIIESQDGFYCELVQLPELSSENLMFITLRRIDFVHELQNLYFSLKCEELVFSSTEP